MVFTNNYMKELSGVDIATKLREIDSDIPIVFATTSTEHALVAYRLNVAKYLEKPVKKSDDLE